MTKPQSVNICQKSGAVVWRQKFYYDGDVFPVIISAVAFQIIFPPSPHSCAEVTQQARASSRHARKRRSRARKENINKKNISPVVLRRHGLQTCPAHHPRSQRTARTREGELRPPTARFYREFNTSRSGGGGVGGRPRKHCRVIKTQQQNVALLSPAGTVCGPRGRVSDGTLPTFILTPPFGLALWFKGSRAEE